MTNHGFGTNLVRRQSLHQTTDRARSQTEPPNRRGTRLLSTSLTFNDCKKRHSPAVTLSAQYSILRRFRRATVVVSTFLDQYMFTEYLPDPARLSRFHCAPALKFGDHGCR